MPSICRTELITTDPNFQNAARQLAVSRLGVAGYAGETILLSTASGPTSNKYVTLSRWTNIANFVTNAPAGTFTVTRDDRYDDIPGVDVLTASSPAGPAPRCEVHDEWTLLAGQDLAFQNSSRALFLTRQPDAGFRSARLRRMAPPGAANKYLVIHVYDTWAQFTASILAHPAPTPPTTYATAPPTREVYNLVERYLGNTRARQP